MATTRAASTAASLSAPTATTAPIVPNPFSFFSHSIEKLNPSMAAGKSNYVTWIFQVLRILKEECRARALALVYDTADDSTIYIDNKVQILFSSGCYGELHPGAKLLLSK